MYVIGCLQVTLYDCDYDLFWPKIFVVHYLFERTDQILCAYVESGSVRLPLSWFCFLMA